MHIIQQQLPNARFRPPATEELIGEVERRLSVSLPASLRSMFLAFDGFREHLGNSQYLFPLIDQDSGGSSLVAQNEFFWNEWNLLDLKPFLFFGLSSADDVWGIDRSDESRIIAYHHNMVDEYEVVGSSILDVYLADQQGMVDMQ